MATVVDFIDEVTALTYVARAKAFDAAFGAVEDQLEAERDSYGDELRYTDGWHAIECALRLVRSAHRQAAEIDVAPYVQKALREREG